ncbi:LptF/LptG family permease [Bartonella ancashensis]|uniref:Permease, YjgP/YjgQ family n=1 Tax=Bartonella ancashensis TaxID=1318743 RepID=A0A0M5KSS9_9HYPH|nr:LptF/LptG family permease [Bartonella ancashensis]ALE03966.1 Permease, YjgP/YjgQ family [Bartonella ancashensis]
MIGWTLGRYFFMCYLKATCYLLLGIIILIFLIDFTENSSKLASFPHYTIKGALLLSALRVLPIVQQILPFIALSSAMIMLISLNKKFELVIARSIGISAWQFLIPACFGAFLFGLFSIFLLNPLAAWGHSKAKQITTAWQNNNVQISTENHRIPWLTHRTGSETTTIGARVILDKEPSLIEATFVQYNEDATIKNWIYTKRATLANDFWILTDGTIYRTGYPPEKFAKSQIKTNLKPEFLTEYLADPMTIPFYELPKKIMTARSLGYSSNKFDMHLQSLIALPALLIAMTFIAATVSLKFTRLEQSGQLILGGIISGFVLYVISVLVRNFGNAGYIQPIIAAWIPVIIALFLGVSFLLHKEDG